jgi:hypothetical protein
VAEFNPPGWLQNAGATHTAAQIRNYVAGLAGGASASAALTSRGGVNISLGNKLVVTQTGSPSMAVLVRSGVAWVPGSEAGSQGAYGVLNDADVTLSITAAHPTLPRIDIVAFKVQDTQYSGATNSCSLVVVTGTAAGSPTAPAAPANSIVLANVAIAAAVSSIVNANITDKRVWLAGAGGVMVCTSGTRPASGTVGVGQLIYESDTTKIYRTDDGGATWSELSAPYIARQTVTGSSVASVTFSGIPTTLRRLSIYWTARGDQAVVNADVRMQINGDTAAHYHHGWVQGNLAGAPAGNFGNAATYGRIGYYAGASALASLFASGVVHLSGWDSPHAGFLGFNGQSQVMGTPGTVQLTDTFGGVYVTAGPYTSITISPTAASNWVVGSDFQLEGWRA